MTFISDYALLDGVNVCYFASRFETVLVCYYQSLLLPQPRRLGFHIVCLFVCLFASRIMQKLSSHFSQNLAEKWKNRPKEKRLDFDAIQITLL